MLSRPPELLLPSRDDGEPRPFGPHSG
jgi:hypothetical protein